MANKRITELPAASSLSANDLLVAVLSPSTTAVTKKIAVVDFLSNVSCPVNISNTANVSNLNVSANVNIAGPINANNNLNVFGVANLSNGLIIQSMTTPANSTSLTISKGTVFFDTNYLYVATSNNVVKRVALSTF